MKQLKIQCLPPQSYFYFFDSIKNHPENHLVILPVNRAGRLLRQELINVAPGHVLANPPVFTFDQLLLELYQCMPQAKRILSDDMIFVLLETILQNKQEVLQYVMKTKHVTSGLVQKITNVVQELRRFGFNSAAFDKAQVDEKSEQPQKYRDFHQLLFSLEEEFGQTFIDQPFARHSAAEALDKKLFFKRFPKVRSVYIAGFGLYTPAMLQFINKVSDWIPLEVKMEFDERNPELFRQTQDVFTRLKSMGATVHSAMERSALSRRLFNRDPQGDLPDMKMRIHVQPLPGRREEVAFIASEIRRLTQQKKIPVSRIAVTFPHLEHYVPLIRQEFKKFGIPYNLSTGFALKQAPLIRLFLKPLEWILTGYQWNDLQTWLQSPLLNAPPMDVRSLHEYFVEKRIRRLTPGWPEKIQKKTAQRLPESKQLPGEAVQALNDFLQPVYLFPQKGTVSEFRTAFIDLLKNLGVLHWYSRTPSLLSDREREKEFRAFNRFMKLLDRLVWMLSHLLKQDELNLEQFWHYLQTAVSAAVYNVTEWQDFGVQVLPRLEVQAVEAQVLFVGGLVDGEFPRASAKDVFFSDAVRDKLGLMATEELLAQDRFIFYSLLDSAARQVYCLYPKYEEERALVPSTFLSDLKEAVQVDVRTKFPSAESLQNPLELWNTFGMSLQKRDWSVAEYISHILRQADSSATGELWSLLRKIGLQLKRHVADGFGPYEGDLSSNARIVAEINARFVDRKWSVTQLEQYAFCPMQYFLNRILKVEPWPVPEDEVTPLERGNTLHRILQRFYEELLARGAQSEPRQHRDRLFSIAAEEFARLPFSGFFWDLELKKYFGTDSAPGLLDVFLEQEEKFITDSGFIPRSVEHSFGGREGAITLQHKTGQLDLYGRIDRVDVRNGQQVMIIDYKTGRTALSKNTDAMVIGISFQLPLYLRAYARENTDMDMAAAAFYLIKDAQNCRREIMMGDKNALPALARRGKAWLPHPSVTDAEGHPYTLAELTDWVLEQAIAQVERLKQARFQHTAFPQDTLCSDYCDYKKICQKQTAKLLKMAEQTKAKGGQI